MSTDTSMFMSPLETLIGPLLRERNYMLAVAESCTGGLVGYRVTSVAGSSDYFSGGIIAYSNELKTNLLNVPGELLKQYGAVSSQCAEAMVSGARARTGAEVAVSTTGIAGPGGATRTKPVGLIYIACQTPTGTIVHEHRWSGSRLENMDLATFVALQLLHEQLSDDNRSPA